jgi:hypothetical protein
VEPPRSAGTGNVPSVGPAHIEEDQFRGESGVWPDSYGHYEGEHRRYIFRACSTEEKSPPKRG